MSKNILKTSDEKFLRLIENSTDGIVIADACGNIDLWNKAMECLTGLNFCDVVGVPVWEVQLRLIPEELRTDELLHQSKTAITNILGDASWTGNSKEQSIISADGANKIVQADSFLIKTSTSVMLGTIMRDVTEWRNSMQKNR